MESCLRLTVILSLAVLASPAFTAQPAPSKAAEADSGSPEVDANLPAMPFMAEMTSDDVVRSGAGTNYYYCNKLKKGDKIKVVGSRYSWLQIVPPAGSYAWISKQYVQVEPPNTAVGTVIGEGVRVYAGSDDVQPMHSTSIVAKLNRGDTVTLLGEEKDGYCKITPPEGAYLWVSNQYVKPLVSLIPPTQPVPSAPAPPPSPFPASTPANIPPAVSPTEPARPMAEDEQKTKEVLLIKEQLDAEKAKPAQEQNFSEMKKTLSEIAANKQTPKAARNAQNLLKTIERYELAKEVSEALKLQDEQTGQTRQRIEEARAAKLSQFEDTGIYAVIGQLKESTIFAEAPGIKYYRITDNEGKTICYARPAGEAVNKDLSALMDKNVGLFGTIEPRPDLGGALVEFTNITELK
jgi:uncharacterized protein YgiM (DUF1202 family)